MTLNGRVREYATTLERERATAAHAIAAAEEKHASLKKKIKKYAKREDELDRNVKELDEKLTALRKESKANKEHWERKASKAADELAEYRQNAQAAQQQLEEMAQLLRKQE